MTETAYQRKYLPDVDIKNEIGYGHFATEPEGRRI
jgi:hypothetical protein